MRMFPAPSVRREGFSLVELSIVLVILGLLVGGVLAGRSLIRAAELRAVASEYQHYMAATYSFRDKYFALPGDFTRAADVWGAEPASHCPGGHTTPSTTKATCNGNGDGFIRWHGNAGYGAEAHRFWQHLANAGLIGGTYTGTNAGGGCNGDGSCNVALGKTAPASRLSKAGWSVVHLGNTVAPGHQYYFAGYYGNVFYFGRVYNYTSESALLPGEAWNLDTKLDDGKPAIGRWRVWNATYHSGCTSGNGLDATYQMAISSAACAAILPLTP